MKRLIVFLLLGLLLPEAKAQAPPSNMDVFDGGGMDGSAESASLKQPNQLKNRYTAPQANQIDHSITLDAMRSPGNDKTRWSSTSGAELTGFVLDVKTGRWRNAQLWKARLRTNGRPPWACFTGDRCCGNSKHGRGSDSKIAGDHCD